jgi:serine protease Do
VTKGSAADQAGLHEGDVILQVNGRGAASPQAAAQLIRQIPIGQSGTITIWRDGDQQQLQVTMRERR